MRPSPAEAGSSRQGWTGIPLRPSRSRAVAGIVDARKVRTISLLKAPTEGGDDPVAWMRERMGDSSRPPDKLVDVSDVA